ncbi:MAG: sce7726 family protein [Bacteroides sp.]|nr:sce7726 family protein [Bacteroides sp.]
MSDSSLNIHEKDRLRSFSTVFTRSGFSKLREGADLSRLSQLKNRYNIPSKLQNYWDFLQFIYRELTRNYRNEYVVKNELLSQILLSKYRSKATSIFSEFKLVHSIGDMAMFNGCSKVFEIKTEFDSAKRLETQLTEYSEVFDKVYVVVMERYLKNYISHIPSHVGIIIGEETGSKFRLSTFREADDSVDFNCVTLLKALHIAEYQNIIISYFGELPEVSRFKMFEECKALFRIIPEEDLRKLFLQQVKQRSTVSHDLWKIPRECRQISLAMKLDASTTNSIKNFLQSIPI